MSARASPCEAISVRVQELRKETLVLNLGHPLLENRLTPRRFAVNAA
jgi:hypothetical protein